MGGAIVLEGKVYVACFGLDTTPGLAVVDPVAGTLEATYAFPTVNGDKLHVHNVYAFDWGGRRELFAAVLGAPWSGIPGRGLVRFDRESSEFMVNTTIQDLHARAAVQQADGSFYVMSQEPSGTESRVVRLEQQGDKLAEVASIALPSSGGTEGGADVMLGREPDTLFCTDRTWGTGKLHYITFSNGSFELVNSRDTGNNPRYSTITNEGNVVVCNLL